MAEEIKEEEPPQEYDLKPYRIIPWIIPKRDGRHEMVLTRLPIHAYYFHSIDYVTIYMKLVQTDVNVIDTTLVGTFPDLTLDPHDKSKVVRINRPVTLAMLSKEEVRAVTQNIDLPEVTKEILDASIDALEGFRSLELQRDLEFYKRELAAERKESLKHLKENPELSEDRFLYYMELYNKGKVSVEGISKGTRVRQILDDKKFQILLGAMFLLMLMYWLGWIF